MMTISKNSKTTTVIKGNIQIISDLKIIEYFFLLISLTIKTSVLYLG